MSHEGEIIAYALSIALLSTCLIVLAIALIFACKKQPVQSEETITPTNPSTVRPYALTEVDLATDGFNPRRILGKGRLGTTYVAILKEGELVAVKRVHSWLVLGHVAGFQFQSTIKSLAHARHPNVVPIVGFSEGPGERILMTEFVGTMSLEFYLHQDADHGGSHYPFLDWGRRVRIVAGIARGLEYLHDKMSLPVVHGCVKPSNIQIDEKFCAKVCDYGLSFLAPKERIGLIGYVDGQEYYRGAGGGACKESDVYGFGVVVLELLTGRKSAGGSLVEWALPLIREMRFGELVDPRLEIPGVLFACFSSSCRQSVIGFLHTDLLSIFLSLMEKFYTQPVGL